MWPFPHTEHHLRRRTIEFTNDWRRVAHLEILAKEKKFTNKDFKLLGFFPMYAKEFLYTKNRDYLWLEEIMY
jgi:hypothetical protein